MPERVPPRAGRPPLATYRVQLHGGFGFDDAAAIADYLADLGVSHLYTSPYFKARAGSDHGYDVADHNSLNPEAGDRNAYDRLCAALDGNGLGQLVDFVPNHMGVGFADNPWWLDVLEWGQDSPFADHFDINWTPAKPSLRNKVVVPFLGDHYGRVLENGELQLHFDTSEGSFSVWFYEHRFPISPAEYTRILQVALAELKKTEPDAGAREALESLGTRFRELGRRARSGQQRLAQRNLATKLKAELAEAANQPPVLAAIEAACRQISGKAGDRASFRTLHRILENQAYRLAYWRVATDEINYRRFFQINDLAGIKTENPKVFDAIHRLVLDLIGEGRIHGLRIDHIDGLFDPEGYTRRLQDKAREVLRQNGRAAEAETPFYVVVEKILADHERLRPGWPVAGTTGYDFLNQVCGMLTDPRGEQPMTRIYRRFVGDDTTFGTVLVGASQQVMDYELSSELEVLATELSRIAESNWQTRDHTLNALRRALKEVIAHFPVYRTYVSRGRADDSDRRDIEWAIKRARKHSTLPDPSIFDFIQGVLTTDLVRPQKSGYNRADVRRFAMKFQQFTGPVRAKGLEDTAFYRYNRLLALNEVGGDPNRFAVSPTAFHRLNQDRARDWPHSMLSTATHDTKRGEDVRARLAVLSEMPAEWERTVRRWSTLTRRWKYVIEDGLEAPTPNDEYMLYQTLVGAWPMELLDGITGGIGERDFLDGFCERIEGVMIKAVREAKVVTAWTNPGTAYEEGLLAFIRRLLDPDHATPLINDIAGFARTVAWYGMLNGLSQAAAKLTSPGIPDLYQGTEFWDLNLVDPDNRRAVDFDRRRRVLRKVAGLGNTPGAARRLLDGWPDGRVKMFVLRTLLHLRRKHPDLFLDGAYVPLDVSGWRAENLCAFARSDGETAVVVLLPRLYRSLGPVDQMPLGPEVWRDTRVLLRDDLPAPDAWREAFTGQQLAESPDGDRRTLEAGRLLTSFPLAVLVG